MNNPYKNLICAILIAGLNFTSFSGINLLGPFPRGLGILTPKSYKTQNVENMLFKYKYTRKLKSSSWHHLSLLQPPLYCHFIAATV